MVDGQHLGLPDNTDRNSPDFEPREDPDAPPFDLDKFEEQFILRAQHIAALAKRLEYAMRNTYPSAQEMDRLDEVSTLYIAVRDIHQIADGI